MYSYFPAKTWGKMSNFDIFTLNHVDPVMLTTVKPAEVITFAMMIEEQCGIYIPNNNNYTGGLE